MHNLPKSSSAVEIHSKLDENSCGCYFPFYQITKNSFQFYQLRNGRISKLLLTSVFLSLKKLISQKKVDGKKQFLVIRIFQLFKLIIVPKEFKNTIQYNTKSY